MSNITRFFRPHFAATEGYISAGMEETKDDKKVFLNANENPFELPGLEGCNRYPEPQPRALLDGMAKLYGVNADNIIITRGADEGIALVLRLFVDAQHDDILINPPTFGVYKVYAGGIPARKVVENPLIKDNGTYKLDIQGIENKLNDPQNAIKLIFLTNPNNPTGTLFDSADIMRIIEITKDRAIIILDETYAEFADGSSHVRLLQDNPHLVILRTLSKSYSMAGMRVGAILSCVPEIISALQTKVMEVYPVPLGSVNAALKVMEKDVQAIAKTNIEKLLAERVRMEKFYTTQKGVQHIYPSATNFLLVEMERASEFCAFTKSKGYILRDFSQSKGSENAVRITIGTPEQNDTLIGLFKEFYGE